MSEQQVDLDAITEKQRYVWGEGDFSKIAHMVVPVAERLCEAIDTMPGERVLDVACGSGNGAIAAARRTFVPTTGSDFVPSLLERGRERAAGERLEVEFVEGNAMDLPFEDASFDVVISIFGAMFAPDQQQAADELLRVCRPGGRIGMCNWTPGGIVGRMFKVTAAHNPPPPGLDPPVRWGTEERLRELFGDGISELRAEPQINRQRFYSPDHYIEVFRNLFGPMKVAFEVVGDDGAEALTNDLQTLLTEVDTGAGRGLALDAEYLEVVATRA